MEENREQQQHMKTVHTNKKFPVLHLAGCAAHLCPFVVVTYVCLCVEVEAENWRVTGGDNGGYSPGEETVP